MVEFEEEDQPSAQVQHPDDEIGATGSDFPEDMQESQPISAADYEPVRAQVEAVRGEAHEVEAVEAAPALQEASAPSEEDLEEIGPEEMEELPEFEDEDGLADPEDGRPSSGYAHHGGPEDDRDGPSEPDEPGDQPHMFPLPRVSPSRRLAARTVRELPDEPAFDQVGAPSPRGEGFEVRPIETRIQEGLSFLCLGTAPSKYMNEKVQQIIIAGGNRIEPCRPGDPLLLPPHAAQNRVAAAGFEPQSRVAKAATRRRFTEEALADEEPRPNRRRPLPASEPAPIIMAPPAAPEAAPEASEDEQRPLTVSLPPVEEVPDGPGVPPILRYHDEETIAPGRGARKGVPAPAVKPVEPARPEPIRPPSARPAPSGEGKAIPWGWLALSGGVAALAVMAFRPENHSRPQDPVVVYALDQREQVVSYLNREIGMLEDSVAQVEMEQNQVAQKLTAEPTPGQWAQLETLGRERNSQIIVLEALRQRRRLLFSRGDAQ